MGELDKRLRNVIHDAEVPLSYRDKKRLARRLGQMVEGWLEQKPTEREKFVRRSTKAIISDFKKLPFQRPGGFSKPRLVDTLAFRTDSNRKAATAFLDTFAKKAITETRTKGAFVIPGLGRLVKSTRKARLGRNPQTGEPIRTPRGTVVKFRPTKAVREAFASSVSLPPKKAASKHGRSRSS
jgi:DNA-binding protein HU-beta